MDDYKYVKIYGERNTGTNYLEKLIQLNTSANLLSGIAFNRKLNKSFYFIERLGFVMFTEFLRNLYFMCSIRNSWKHKELVDTEKLYKDVFYVVVVKNPYTFLLSLYKKSYHIKKAHSVSFLEFLKSPIKALKREGEGYYLNPIELWKRKTKNLRFLQENNNNIIVVRYEDLLANPEKEILKICKNGNLQLKDKFVNYSKSTKNKSLDFNFYKNKYLSEEWKKDFKQDELKFIKEQLDVELMKEFNY